MENIYSKYLIFTITDNYRSLELKGKCIKFRVIENLKEKKNFVQK